MYVDPTSAGAPAQAAQSTGPALDYQMFLKLLIAEMKNQDPTNPMDSAQYVAQLASFSQVEQTVQTNKKLDSLLQASTLSQAASFIGKEIASFDGTVAGIVKEVKIYSDGVVAVLTDGREVALTAGVTIRESGSGGVGEGAGETGDPQESAS